MFSAALLRTIEESGIAVLTLTEDLTDTELLASRLTRFEVAKHIRNLLTAACSMPLNQQQEMPEIDWAGLNAHMPILNGPAGPALDEALMFSVRSLVPATLMWLRVYRQQHPAWFKLTPA